MRLLVLLLAVFLLAHGREAAAHHRQTPPIVAFTSSGEGSLPRLPPPSRKAAAAVVDGTIVVVSPFKNPSTPTFTFTTGANANPAISYSGRILAWESKADAPGQQILLDQKSAVTQATTDPTGTSTNPALDLLGLYVAFQSSGNLASQNAAGALQVFLRDPAGAVTQVSRGSGTSQNASIGTKGRQVVFESTSDPVSGFDTGVSQVWVADLLGATTAPITAGLGPSRNPALSSDGRLVAFESTADLAGDQSDTGVPQIFTYDTRTQTFARLTNDAGGCSAPAVMRIRRDWRITYLCGSGDSATANFTMLRTNQRVQVQTDGNTTRIVPQGDVHFVLVATTADLLGGGSPTSDHRVYMVNLFKRPPASVTSNILWFPHQGIPPL
jgi:Tol biopolymer transport system component